MAFLSSLLNTINTIPPDAWELIVETIVGALTVSPLLVGLKKWWSIDSSKKMIGLVILGSLLAGAAAYLRGVPQFAPWLALVQGWLILATSQPVYYFFIKPLFQRIGRWFGTQVARATAITEAKSAAIPAGGLPTISPQETFDH